MPFCRFCHALALFFFLRIDPFSEGRQNNSTLKTYPFPLTVYIIVLQAGRHSDITCSRNEKANSFRLKVIVTRGIRGKAAVYWPLCRKVMRILLLHDITVEIRLKFDIFVLK